MSLYSFLKDQLLRSILCPFWKDFIGEGAKMEFSISCKGLTSSINKRRIYSYTCNIYIYKEKEILFPPSLISEQPTKGIV